MGVRVLPSAARPADYWATLDLDWWEKEGYPKHQQAIRDFPWDTLED